MWRRLCVWLRSLPGRLFWWPVPGLKEQYMGGFGTSIYRDDDGSSGTDEYPGVRL